MKKALFILVMFVMTLQVAFAQRGRVVTIYFHNGSIVKGEISKLPNEERFRIQTPNGSVILFTSSAVRDILYEDGTRPGSTTTQPPYAYQQQPQYQSQPQYQQQPPYQQPQQQYQQPQQQQQYRQQPQQAYQQPAEVQQQSRVRVQPDEELPEEDFYDDYEDFEEEEVETPLTQPGRVRTADASTAPAPDFVPGYHGLVEFGYTIGMGDSIHAFNRMELTVTQGYQFSPALFAGLGFGVHLYSDSIPLNKIVDGEPVLNTSFSYVFPVFLDLRYNFSNGKIRPFAGLKAGYGIGLSKTRSTTVKDGVTSNKLEYKAEPLGFYLAPTVGAKFMIGRSMAFTLGASYSMQLYTDESLKPGTTNTIIKKMDIMGGVTLRAGLEF